MRQPEGYVIPGREKEVCDLKKPIYGTRNLIVALSDSALSAHSMTGVYT
jgi:hypothetical protein